MYKSQLQEVCQQRGWALPTYQVTKQGHDHHPLFYATVTVNSALFSTPFPSSSSKKAQSDAAKLAYNHFSSTSRPSSSPLFLAVVRVEALGWILVYLPEGLRNSTSEIQLNCRIKPWRIPKMMRVLGECSSSCSKTSCKTMLRRETSLCPTAKAALMSLLPNGVEEDESRYKNLLQDLAQREGYGLQTYCTEKYGEAHAPIFVSTVEIEGEIFTGAEAKTKKQAERSAAKVAYTALKQEVLLICHLLLDSRLQLS
ncbi:hypothetical protein OIU78_022462 [Salix suchowensis]|nr:hypothetical protein OIU78_022462 [Salix suchowensis]